MTWRLRVGLPGGRSLLLEARMTKSPGTSPLKPQEIHVDSWIKLRNKLDAISAREGEWLFKGLPKCDYQLETTLERAVRRYWPDGVLPAQTSVTKIEDGLVREFMRQIHRYAPNEFADRDHPVERLALMRHYGAPSRLLDWTYSPYVAAFFALEKVNPVRMTERLVIQQGIFLCPGNVERSFEDNLVESLREKHDVALVKIVISGDAATRRSILLELHRMNMNRAVLFPGLEGFASSLDRFVAKPERSPGLPDI